MAKRTRKPQPAAGIRFLERDRLIGVGLLGAVLFFVRLGAQYLNPSNTRWLLGNPDSAVYQLGWQFFRNEGWHWPLGWMDGYLYPDGSSVALTDSLPLLALPLKLLLFMIPTDFQYFGFWLLVTHVLQAVFAYLVVRRFVVRFPLRLLATALLALAPAFLNRDGHIALSSHWVLLAALWLYLDVEGAYRWQRVLARWAVLVGVTCLIHAYLALMVAGLAAAGLVRDWWPDRRLSWQRLLLSLAGLLAVMAVVWFSVGYLEVGDAASISGSVYGTSALNLNFAFNGQDVSRLLPDLPVAIENRFEGFNSLGMGGLIAVVGALVLVARRRSLPWSLKRHLPLMVLLAGFFLVAVTHRLAWGDRVLLDGALPQWLIAFLNPFRASARFIWPVHYVLLAAAISVVARLGRQRWLPAILAVGLVLQVVDLGPLLDRRDAYAERNWQTRMRSRQWERMAPHFDKLLSYPPKMQNTFQPNDFIDLALWAREHDMPTSAGYAARQFHSDVMHGVAFMKDLMYGPATDPDAIYVMRNSYFAWKWRELQERFTCTNIDNFVVCFAEGASYLPPTSYHVETIELADYLATFGDRTVFLAAKGQARRRLGDRAEAVLDAMGSRYRELDETGSWVMILHRGRIVFEDVQNGQKILITAPVGGTIETLRLKRELWFVSSGYDVGDAASLQLDRREMYFNRDGLNIAVLDDNENLIEAAVFETHKQSLGHVFSLKKTPHSAGVDSR